jgi:hypothetical protein
MSNGLKIFSISFVLVLCLQVTAATCKAQAAYKIDEIENPRCDLSEVPPLDPPPYGKFATALRDRPDDRGAIVMYGLQGEAGVYAKQVKYRLIHMAGVASERLVIIYGGYSENSRMELWIISKEAVEPKFNVVVDNKNAQKFDLYAYWDGYACGSGRLPALDELAKTLKERPDWQGYIVIRPHRNKRGMRDWAEGWDPDGFVSRQQALRRVAQDKRYLVKKSGISPSRLKAVVGDNDKWTHAELWLVPPGVELTASEVRSLTKKR